MPCRSRRSSFLIRSTRRAKPVLAHEYDAMYRLKPQRKLWLHARSVTFPLKWLSLCILSALFLFANADVSAAPNPGGASLRKAVLATNQSDAAQTSGSNFEPVSCSAFKISGDAFDCGYITVPELHADPNGKQIKLAVGVLPSTNTTPTRDAYVVAEGGPGGSTLDTFTAFFQQGYYPAVDTLRAERDVVLYDQRGTLYSQPALTCPEELQETFDTIEQEIPPEESLRLSEQAALACRARLVKERVNLSAYNSIENALDIEDVRRALGYEKFDLYGVSYGTLLALHALRQTPETFRSVILDAVVPAQINPNSAIAESQNRAFEQLFDACAADADCGRAYPDLKQVFYARSGRAKYSTRACPPHRQRHRQDLQRGH